LLARMHACLNSRLFVLLFRDADGDECVLEADASKQVGGVGVANPFLDVPNASAAIEYKKGYVMRKCCVDPNGKKSELLNSHFPLLPLPPSTTQLHSPCCHVIASFIIAFGFRGM